MVYCLLFPCLLASATAVRDLALESDRRHSPASALPITLPKGERRLEVRGGWKSIEHFTCNLLVVAVLPYVTPRTEIA